MNKNTWKGIVTLALIIPLCAIFARMLTSAESVADYAEKHPEQQNTAKPTIEVIPTPEATQIADEPEPTIEPTPIPEPSPEVREEFYIEEIDDELKAKMKGVSYPLDIDETKISYDELRHLVITYVDFDGNPQRGELVCNEAIAEDLKEIFEELYKAGYQLENVRLIDEYDADDDTSMEANNTSCFCYRVVDHTTKLSYHAYGLAIDVNPFYNPYVQMRNGEQYVCPTMSVDYADRNSDFPYKIDENDLAYKLFKQHGFIWGGDWNSCKDYQHFEKRIK